MRLNAIKRLDTDEQYSRVFAQELEAFFELFNRDIRAALKSGHDVVGDIEYIMMYYMFVYLTQIAMRLDDDLLGKKAEDYKLYFKHAKEPVSDDRDCVIRGWKIIEVKSKKLFAHLIVLNMLIVKRIMWFSFLSSMKDVES